MGDHHSSPSLSDVDLYHQQRPDSRGRRRSGGGVQDAPVVDHISAGLPFAFVNAAASSAPEQKTTSRKQTSLAHIAIPSFSAFRSQVSSIPYAAPAFNAQHSQNYLPASSPRHFSFAAEPSPRLGDRTPRPVSVATTVPTSNGLAYQDTFQRPQRRHDHNTSIDSRIAHPATSSIPIHETYVQQRSSRHRPKHSSASITSSRSSMNSRAIKPSMTLEFNGVQRKLSNESISTDSSEHKRSKSPGRLGAFFGWNKSSPYKGGTESPTTTFSDRSLSPQPSPRLEKVMGDSRNNNNNNNNNTTSSGKAMPQLGTGSLNIDTNNYDSSRFFESPTTPIMMDGHGMGNYVHDLERELSQISTELAGSIRREMDLEDEIDRLKLELPSIPPSEMSRRGSDYFSDSGAGSVRYPISDPDAKIEEVERLRRRAEQDKAQMKLDITQKLQMELARRRELEAHIHSLEEQIDRRPHEDTERKDRRVEELEAQLEDTRRRWNQEKEARENFEDLYTALHSEFSSGRRGMGRGFGSIAEETHDGSSGMPRTGVTRSGSLARSSSLRGSVTRSGSVKGGPEGGRQRSGSQSAPVTIEGLKEVEDQRDALQQALKLLISRHEKQQRDHQRHMKKLTKQNAVALKLSGQPSSQRSQYQREVAVLKEEVNTLRKRTEDALEQKWQYEKSLGGIKMDLDRAEHETRGLRTLLQEHDIMAPSPSTLHSATFSALDDADQHLSAAESDREQAKQLALEFRKRASQLHPEAPEQGDLREAAGRMDQLSQQFDSQAKTNSVLRDRLAAAVEKGEHEQQQSTKQIEEMQKRLATMEDSVLAAQQHSETTLLTHETEVRAIEEATSPRLQRLNLDVPEPSKLSPASPGLMKRSKSMSSRVVSDASLLDASRTNMLEGKVRELERLLRDAEDDMQHVVTRVNKSQLEVAELTNERDAAFTQMRKLQDRLVQETERAEMLLKPSKPYRRQYDGADDSASDYGDN